MVLSRSYQEARTEVACPLMEVEVLLDAVQGGEGILIATDWLITALALIFSLRDYRGVAVEISMAGANQNNPGVLLSGGNDSGRTQSSKAL